ncbi:MAG: hypothetical protein WCW87_01770 [Candidatus Paceibacterota bacterium]
MKAMISSFSSVSLGIATGLVSCPIVGGFAGSLAGIFVWLGVFFGFWAIDEIIKESKKD